jgi:hypothetical protein
VNRARYLFRIDDVAPTMAWSRFSQLMTIFRRHGIKPLLGVVPDNRDSSLAPELARPDFWETMRRLQQDQLAEFWPARLSAHSHTKEARPAAPLE